MFVRSLSSLFVSAGMELIVLLLILNDNGPNGTPYKPGPEKLRNLSIPRWREITVKFPREFFVFIE